MLQVCVSVCKGAVDTEPGVGFCMAHNAGPPEAIQPFEGFQDLSNSGVNWALMKRGKASIPYTSGAVGPHPDTRHTNNNGYG